MKRRLFPVILCCLLVFTIIFAIFYGREDLGLNTIPKMENAIRSAVGQSEYSDLAVESKIEIQEIILGSFSGSEKNEALVYSTVAPVKRNYGPSFSVAAVFDLDTVDLTGAQFLMEESVVLKALPTQSDRKDILYLGETIDMGLSSYNIKVWDFSGGKWKELKLPSFDTTDADENITAEISKANEIILLHTELEGLTTETANVTAEKYNWVSQDETYVKELINLDMIQ